MNSDASDGSAGLIEAAVEQVFGTLTTVDVIARAEAGEWAQRLWDTACESGFDRALLPEASGGIEATWSTVLPILRGIGFWQVPLPLAETLIGRFLASQAGLATERIATLTIGEADDSAVLGIGAAGGSINATVPNVPWAHACEALLVSFRTSAHARRIALVRLDAAQMVRRANTAGEPRDTVTFRGAPCLFGELPTGLGLERPVHELGAFARSAMMSGAMSHILAQCIEYANLRVQFGRAIGKFQAVQQQLALMAGEVCSARSAVEAAAASLGAASIDATAQPSGPNARFDIAVAKVRSGEAATAVAAIAHAVHGAIGFTREHRLHFATRRLWSWRSEYGTDAQWAEALGRAAIGMGAGGFWPALTARSFPL